MSGQSVGSEDKFKYHTGAKSVVVGNRMIIPSLLSWLMLIAGLGTSLGKWASTSRN